MTGNQGIELARANQPKLILLDIDLPDISGIEVLERLLRGAGYASVTSTTDPTEVSRLHRENGYDLILLDLEMPGMDGFEVMERLKPIEKDGYLPVLVITAQSEHRLRALKVGAKDFVSKPLDIAEVVTRVYNMLEVRLLHRQTRKLYDQVVAEQLEALERFNHDNDYTLQVRIGIHSGAVMAGVIGKRKFIYDLWGDAVNTASRMESHGMAARVQMTEDTRRLLSEPFVFEERGAFEIKGKGELRTWFLLGRSKSHR